MQFAIKYRGKPLELTPALPDDATVGDLRRRVADAVGSEVTKTRLLVTGGKALLPGDDDIPLSAKLPSSSSQSNGTSATTSTTGNTTSTTASTTTILVLATAASGHAKLAETATSPLLKHHRVHDDTGIPRSSVFSDDTNAGQQRSYKYVGVPSTTTNNNVSGPGGNNYGFGIVEALPDYADHAAAQRVLQRLASDAGILSAMRQRGWRVGALREMRPQGRVGLDPCLMGYNRNRGEEICLRLRTDDNKGFRQLGQLLHVLAHELAHNEHDGHGVEFKETMRWIERTVAQNPDWRGDGGRSLTDGAMMKAVPMRSFAGGGGASTTQAETQAMTQPVMARGGGGEARRRDVGAGAGGMRLASANSRRSRLLEQAERAQRERRQANGSGGRAGNARDDGGSQSNGTG